MVIYYHRLEIYKQPTKFYNHDSYKVEELHLLAENDRYMVFNDMHFTKIEKLGDGRVYSCLNKPSIYFKDVLGSQGIFYSVYTEKRMRPSTIKAQIKRKAEKEYGWLLAESLDLSILTKKSPA